MTTYKSIKYNISGADLTGIPTSAITSGTMADARISASSVTSHVNLTPVRQDVLTLALKQAVQENSTKFNLPNSAITKFEADADLNLGGSTTALRHASEYIWAATTSSTTGAHGTPDANCMLYMNWDSATTTATGQEVSSPGWTLTAGGGGTIALNTSEKKFGASSLYVPPNSYLNMNPSGGVFNSSYSGDWTIEFWYKMTARVGYGCMISKSTHTNNNFDWRMYLDNASGTTQVVFCDVMLSGGEKNINSGALDDTSAWTHYAYTRDGSTMRFYEDGVQLNTATSASGTLNANYGNVRIGETFIASGDGEASGYYDDMRLSDNCRYPNGTTFTPNETTTIVANATGTALGTTNVPSSAVTDVSGVMLLKHAYGANTLGTDVKIYFTADNSNWTEATSYADAGTFSTGIKMIKLGKTTCTSGSDVRWKAVWANQSASSKEAHIYGIGLNY